VLTSKQLVQLAKQAAEEKKGCDPVIIDLKGESTMASYFLIVHGTSDRHVKAIAESVIDALGEAGEPVWHREGLQEGRWALLDYGDVVVHVFHYEARTFYNLERLWGGLHQTRNHAR